jgi:hypothetical protein
MGVESMLEPFVRQAETYGLAACLLGRDRDCQRYGELLITARRAADMAANDASPTPSFMSAEPDDLCLPRRGSVLLPMAVMSDGVSP